MKKQYKPLRIFSFGGGVQSMACLVLAAQQRITYDAFVFANVGDHAENPATLEYFEQVAKPFATQAGIALLEIQRVNRLGERVDLYDYTMAANKSIPIPVIMPSGAFGNRSCTTDWKIEQIDKYAKSKNTTHLMVGLCISTDEFQRMKALNWQNVTKSFAKRVEYPLIDLGISRKQCKWIIQQAGLPVPPKSSCWFCPFHKKTEWVTMRREEPMLFDKAIHLDTTLRERFINLGRGTGCYIHQGMQPLEQATAQQPLLPGMEENCESGYCLT